MEGRIGAVFIMIQLDHGPINLLDFFHRSWNAELMRSASLEPTGCLLRFPLLRVNNRVHTGVVASVLTTGVVRVASAGSVEDAMAIADFVYAYVTRRLTSHSTKGDVKYIVMFRAILNPILPLPKHKFIDTSEATAEWLRERISSFSAAACDNKSGTDSRQSQWWRCLTGSSVAHRQYRQTLRVVCEFRQPSPQKPSPGLLCPSDNRDVCNHDANAFFFGSELMSVMPLGSVFVEIESDRKKSHAHNGDKSGNSEKAEGHDDDDAGGDVSHKRRRYESEKATVDHNVLQTPQEVDTTPELGPLRVSSLFASSQVAGRTMMAVDETEVCPLVPKPRVKVEAMIYRTGRVSATADSVEGLSFFVQEILLPLFQR